MMHFLTLPSKGNNLKKKKKNEDNSLQGLVKGSATELYIGCAKASDRCFRLKNHLMHHKLIESLTPGRGTTTNMKFHT